MRNNIILTEILFTILLIAYHLLLVASVNAAGVTNCQPIYGGGQTCVQGEVIINKTVLNPKTNVFVENLGTNDARHAPDQQITFQLSVTNSSNSQVSKVTIKDIFPQYVNFISGAGSFANNIKTLTFDVANLNPNETRNFTLNAQVVSANQLPAGQAVVCLVNQALAIVDTNQSQDNVQFCIEKTAKAPAPTTTKGGLKVFAPAPTTTTPSTGPELLSLLALVPTGYLGHMLRKKTARP